MTFYDCVVIGGGMAGSYIMNTIHQYNPNICLLEASYKTGGRHWTVKEDCKVLYEAGAWRVHSSHKRMINLIKKLGLTLEELEYQKASEPELASIKGLSKLDLMILNNDGDISKALKEELKTGYQGTYDGVSNTYPYSVSTKEGLYYTIKEGQESIINRLLEDIPEDKIKTKHRVMDVKRIKNRYHLKVYYGEDIKEKEIICNHLFSCVAQFDAWGWSIVQDYLYPLLNSVKPLALHHIYARGKGDFKGKRKVPSSILQQVIPPTHDKKWFQVSYSAGRAAEFWNHYKLKHGKKGLKKLLEEYSGFELEEIESYHWTYAYHLWQTVPQFNLKNAVKFSIMPNPNILPNFYWAGECFSSYQGWSEGALETANMVLDCYDSRVTYVPIYKKVPEKYNEYMIFDGRILDVKRWKEVHPGSKQLIVKYLGKDISKRFRFIKHSDVSWAALYSLQIGYLEK